MTILSETVLDYSFLLLLGFIPLAIGIILICVGAKEQILGIGIVGLVLASMGIVMICGSSAGSRETQYKVLLNDTYPAKELLQSYEVVGQDGEIYILKAKESGEDARKMREL